MFDDQGNLTRPWIYFFERLAQGNGNPAASGGLNFRTLLLKDATVGNDIADHVVVHQGGDISLAAGVLRKVITADLTVTLDVVTSSGATLLGTFTIPAATAINTPVSFPASVFSTTKLTDMQVLAWNVTASDGSSDLDGVASFTLWWQ